MASEEAIIHWLLIDIIRGGVSIKLNIYRRYYDLLLQFIDHDHGMIDNWVDWLVKRGLEDHEVGV